MPGAELLIIDARPRLCARAQCLWGIIEFLTKFATVRAAVTGEAFFEAARNVTELLRRNFLKAFGLLLLILRLKRKSVPPAVAPHRA